MKNRLWLLVAGGLLASCGLLPGVGGQQVNGTFSDSTDGTFKWANVNAGKVRLALIGVTASGITSYNGQAELKDIKTFKSYTMELPTNPPAGAYRVYAYCDANGSGSFDSGEDIADSGSKLLVWSAADGSFTFGGTTFNVKKGWNGYDSSQALGSGNPYQGENYNNYNLTLRANCS